MLFCGCYYSSAWKGIPVSQALVWLSKWWRTCVQNRQGRQQREERMGTKEAGPARSGERRQQVPGAKRNEAEMKTHELEGEMGFGANSSWRLNMASENWAKYSNELAQLLLQLFCLCLPSPGSFLPFPFQRLCGPGKRWWAMGESGGWGMEGNHKPWEVKSFRSNHFEGRKMALQSPKFPPPPPSCPPFKGGWGSPAACIKY